MDPLADAVGRLDIAARVPQAELAAGNDACAVVLRVLDPPSEADRAVLRSFESEQGIRVYLQTGGPATVAPLTPGRPPLAYRLPAFGLTIEFEPTDFIQVNGALNESIVARAVERLDPQPEEHVLDLFCGLGNFSLPLATRARRVTGVEGEAALVARAAANARRAGLGNADFVAADLASPAADAPWARGAYARVLLDPPRAGAREVLPVVGRCGAGRVVYISCHPGSLARDAGILVREHGFRLAAAGVMDMFPHTIHVEAMAVFER
jgi:23S rRNA (uracil1939-C5)-methyltransferase